jgi:diaminohydroxyphosphoribosylaminopyrimidine deaminase/5-amino-6-(5-phosphoribosylamino)uracil reductase
MTTNEQYMYRCLELAEKAAGNVAPNPMVGAVLVHKDRIIGEGYHKAFGGPHAEVNCISSVKESDRQFISSSTLYVSLEPCSHHGKTPPCADMIIRERIPEVVIGCRDPFPQVNGSGIEKLIHAGVSVRQGVLENESINLNKRFFTFHRQQRPYIILKWAQTADGKISGRGKERISISNDITNKLVHQWRSAEAAILVGTETALLDDPFLTNRTAGAKQPIRLVIDRELRLPGTLNIFNADAQTIIFNTKLEERRDNLYYCKLGDEKDLLPGMLKKLYSLQIQSVLVEGGKTLHESFIHSGHWDELRRIISPGMNLPEGYPAPGLPDIIPVDSDQIMTDRIDYFQRPGFLKTN